MTSTALKGADYRQATPDQPGLNAHSYDAEANLLGAFLAEAETPNGTFLALASGNTEAEARGKIEDILAKPTFAHYPGEYKVTTAAPGPWGGIEPRTIVYIGSVERA